MSKFEKIKVGDKAELKHLITQEDINKFVDLTGDDNKLHVDKAFAETTSFKNPVAHGMLGASFISTIIGTKIPGDGALWYSQSIEFLLPVRIGDELTVTAVVIKKTEQLNIIELQTDIFNQHKQKVTSGIAKVKIVEQEIVSEILNEHKEVKIKTALIIGATGGIGTATCMQLAKDGYNIGIHYNSNKDAAEKILNEINALGIKACIVSGTIACSNDADVMVEEVSRKIGAVSLLVNCATLKLPTIKVEDIEWESFQGHFDINVKTNFFLSQKLIPIMKNLGYGKFIFISSQVTDGVPPAQWSFYTTAKYALNGFAKSLAVELAAHNINVNIVSPGMTETNLIADIQEKARALMAAKTPLKRLAKPTDVANAISFLASENANFITGETIRVNGGQVMI